MTYPLHLHGEPTHNLPPLHPSNLTSAILFRPTNTPTPDPSTINTPLPPSVEKAYYRKCIELKRRLNDVEAANDEAKVRRERLDRGILKMRLERAILLDDLRRKMEGREGDAGSEGSAEYAGAMVSV